MRILVSFFIILSLFCGIAITTASASDSTETVKQLFDDGSEGLVDVSVEEYWNDNHFSGYIVLMQYEETDDQTGELNAYTKFYVYYDGISEFLGQCSTEMISLLCDLTTHAKHWINKKDMDKRYLKYSLDYHFDEILSPGSDFGIQPLPEVSLVNQLGNKPPIKVFRKTKTDSMTGQPCITLFGLGQPSVLDFGNMHPVYRVYYDYWVSFAYVDKQTKTIQYTEPVNTGNSGRADFIRKIFKGDIPTFGCVNGSVVDTLLTAGGFL